MKVYVVVGSTGEYNDRSEWLVAAYTTEEDAKLHVLKASEWAAEYQKWENHNTDWGKQKEKKKSNPLDGQFDCDYTGTRYSYESVELKDDFTTPEPIN